MLAALILGLSLFGPAHPGAGDSVKYKTLSGWRLGVLTDRFTGARRCELHKGDMAYRRGAVVFSFRPTTETYDAIYRLDLGQPMPASAHRADLVKAGLPIGTDNLENPSGGKVMLMAADLNRAARIDIRPNRKADPARFDLHGLWPALDAAAARGCDPASSYTAS